MHAFIPENGPLPLCPKIIVEGTRLTRKTDLALALIDHGPGLAGTVTETYQTWVRLSELHRYYSWIVDRFHLPTQVVQQRRGRPVDFGRLEERLAPLGFAAVLCTRPPDSFAEARRERLKVSANPSRYDDRSVFVDEQHRLREAAAAGRLPVLDGGRHRRTAGAAVRPGRRLPRRTRPAAPAHLTWCARTRRAARSGRLARQRSRRCPHSL